MVEAALTERFINPKQLTPLWVPIVPPQGEQLARAKRANEEDRDDQCIAPLALASEIRK
jgi:hypothetical protein